MGKIIARMKMIRGLVVWCYYYSGTNINIKLKMAGKLKGIIMRIEVILYYYCGGVKRSDLVRLLPSALAPPFVYIFGSPLSHPSINGSIHLSINQSLPVTVNLFLWLFPYFLGRAPPFHIWHSTWGQR